MSSPAGWRDEPKFINDDSGMQAAFVEIVEDPNAAAVTTAYRSKADPRLRRVSVQELVMHRRALQSCSDPSRHPAGGHMLGANQEGAMTDKRDDIAEAQNARANCMVMLEKIKRNGVRPGSKISREEVIGQIMQEVIRLDKVIRDSTWKI